MRLSQLFVHPLKSGRSIASHRAYAAYGGLLHDRTWLLTTPDGDFITARTDPVLLTVEAEPWPGMLLLRAAGMAPIAAFETRYTTAVRARVWHDEFSAYHGDAALDAWFGQLLGKPCRLLWLGTRSTRQRPELEQPVSFADGYPYLLVNQASLDALNSALAATLGVRSFRPNLVVDGFDAWAEDGWHTLQIGNIVFDVAKPCTRCVLTTLDPDSGARRRDAEPLRWLGRERRHADGVHFGVNLIARNEGLLEVGASVTLLD